jgi:hypothetical protein
LRGRQDNIQVALRRNSSNDPGDVDKLFKPHLKDMGWTFRVDTEVPRQIDGYNSGVFLLGYVACMMYEMSPRRLTPMLIQGFCIRLFGEGMQQLKAQYGPQLYQASQRFSRGLRKEL